MRAAPPGAFKAYMASLPPQRGGVLLFALWINAVATLALLAAQVALVLRAVHRVVRTDHPIETILGCVVSPSAAAVVSASALHKLVRERFARRLDQSVLEWRKADSSPR